MKPNQFTTIIEFIVEMLVRLFSGKPKFFKVAQIIVLVCGGALALLNWVIDPATPIDLSPKLHDIFTFLIAILGTLAVAFQLPVDDKK